MSFVEFQRRAISSTRRLSFARIKEVKPAAARHKYLNGNFEHFDEKKCANVLKMKVRLNAFTLGIK